MTLNDVFPRTIRTARRGRLETISRVGRIVMNAANLQHVTDMEEQQSGHRVRLFLCFYIVRLVFYLYMSFSFLVECLVFPFFMFILCDCDYQMYFFISFFSSNNINDP